MSVRDRRERTPLQQTVDGLQPVCCGCMLLLKALVKYPQTWLAKLGTQHSQFLPADSRSFDQFTKAFSVQNNRQTLMTHTGRLTFSPVPVGYP